MKKLRSKTMAILIAALLTFAMTSMMLIPSANAHTPKWNIATYSFCSVSPDPVGVGQYVNINFWVNEPPPTASAQYGDRWEGLTVKVTAPGGTVTTLGPFTSDATGGMHTSYTPNAVGNYTFQMFFPGQTLAGNNLPPGGGLFGTASYAFIGDYFEPSNSSVFTLTVQQAPIGYAPVNPLPTSYWTRPINALNNNWYTLGGNWLGFLPTAFANTGCYNGSVNYNPYTTAPTTAHILWTKPVAFGGTMGGEFGGSEESNFYSASQYEPKFAPIIISGILYYELYPGSSTDPTGFTAVDLQTGQTLWTVDTTAVLRCGQALDMITPNQYGGLAYLWTTGTPASVAATVTNAPGTTTYNMYDAMTGSYILSIVNGTALTLTEDEHGDLIGYFIDTTNPFAPTLDMWNSTRCINLGGGYGAVYGVGSPIADNWAWRPTQGAIIPFDLGIQWTAPVASSIAGNPLFNPAAGLVGLSISGTDSGVVLMKATDISELGYQPGWMIEAGYSATDGSQLWLTNQTEAPFSLVSLGAGTMFIGDGIFAEYSQSPLTLTCYSLATGKQLWIHTLPNARSFDSLAGNSVIANGTIYLWTYGGDVYAYNIATGNLEWQYHTPTGGYESPYGYESLWCFSCGTVAGGELFIPEGHEYSPPLFHGAQQLALNITDGQVIWNVDAFDVTANAISDGIMTTLNAYDNQIYGFGMGPSKTTISAPQVGVTTATPVTIIGSVTDISAGASQNAVAANFPNGLPCVSDSSMTQFMEAVYEQQPMPTNTTGVPVTFTVIDSNNNLRSIGSTTTNALGDYSFNWKPDIAGNYTIYATFAGSGAYYSSSASTGFYANAAASTPAPTPTPLSGIATQSALEYIGIAIIIVIIVGIAVIAMLVTRKHP